MRERLIGFLGNESRFGRAMTRCGIVISANVLFVLFSLPFVTAGAAYAALWHVMLKTLRGDGSVNPFRQFWAGFRSNFKQATLVWIAALALAAVGWMDLRFCAYAGGVFTLFRYALYALGTVLLILLLYLFPTMAAFADTIPRLIRNSIFFALKKPLKLLALLLLHLIPAILTYADLLLAPLFAFIWCFFGFGTIVMLGARLLLPEFKPYLPLVDECGDFILDESGVPLRAGVPALSGGNAAPEKSEEEILREMERLDAP